MWVPVIACCDRCCNRECWLAVCACSISDKSCYFPSQKLTVLICAHSEQCRQVNCIRECIGDHLVKWWQCSTFLTREPVCVGCAATRNCPSRPIQLVGMPSPKLMLEHSSNPCSRPSLRSVQQQLPCWHHDCSPEWSCCQRNKHE